jgi:tetratricopeptide (TPR) repeat protein
MACPENFIHRWKAHKMKPSTVRIKPVLEHTKRAFVLGGLILLAACQSTRTNSGEPSNKNSETRGKSVLETQRKDGVFGRTSTDWDKVVEQLSKGPLSEAEADLAFLIAEQYMNQKQLEPATRLMRAVFNSHPTLVSGIELVRLVTLNGELAEAEQISRKLQLFYPKSPDPALAQSYIAQLKGARNEAIEILAQTYKRHPNNEEVAARYISVLIETGQKTKAKDVLLSAIAAMTQSPYFLLRLARLRSEEKQFKDAKNLLDKLLKVAPENIEAWTLAGFIAAEEKNYAAAERYFREAYEKQPENDTLARYYVTQLLRLNKFQEARRLLLRLEATADGDGQLDPDLTFQLAFVFFQLEEFAESKKRFLDLLDKANDKGRIYFYAAQCEDRLKNLPEALKYYQLVSGDAELTKIAQQRIIQIKIEEGKFPEAESLLKTFAESQLKKPTEDDFKFLAGSHSKMAQFTKAQSFAELGLQKFPQNVDLLYLKAAYMEHTVSRSASIAALEKVISKHTDHVQTLNHLGYTLAEANYRLDFALTLLQRALQKEPKNGFYLDSLGWIHFKLKQYAEAEKHLTHAVRLEPNEPVIHEHLGELKLAKGDLAGALRAFEAASALFEKIPKWRIETELEWRNSKTRVEARIRELRRKALPTGAS